MADMPLAIRTAVVLGYQGSRTSRSDKVATKYGKRSRPATFVIDKLGVLRRAWRAQRYDDRSTPQQIVDVLNSLDDERYE